MRPLPKHGRYRALIIRYTYMYHSIIRLWCLLLAAVAIILPQDARAQQMPYVYDVENTGEDCPAPPLPGINDLTSYSALPDPFEWSDATRGRIQNKSDWRCRRAEIGAELQHYEMGDRPAPPEKMEVSYEDGRLTIEIEEDGKPLTLTSTVRLPEGDGPFPVVIGVEFFGMIGSLPADIFTSRDIAMVGFNYADISGADAQSGSRSGPFYDLYPRTIGKFAGWSWGVSRLIDALEQVPELDLDLSRIGMTGCSFAGKIALFSGAFDERIALTIAQEPGGGGAASWRVTNSLDGSREGVGNTNGSWFKNTFINTFRNNIYRMPYDHHELVAMVAPRAMIVLGNADYEWMADESAHVSSKAAQTVWEALDVPDRFGFVITDGHGHCQVSDTQRKHVEDFVDRFLLHDEAVDTRGVEVSPFEPDLDRWIRWDHTVLSASEIAPGSRSGDLINYPNPFSSETVIEYDLAQTSPMSLRIYDVTGALVRELINAPISSGRTAGVWDGRDASGRIVAPGVYIARMEAGDQTSNRLMTLIR